MRVTRVVASLSLALVALAISGCSPKKEPMPLLVVVDEEGWATVSFQVCAGEAVRIAGVSLGQDEPALLHGEVSRSFDEDTTIELTINADTIEQGRLTDELPLSTFRPFPAPTGLGDLERLTVVTSGHHAGLDLRAHELRPDTEVIVFGTKTDSEYSVSPIGEVEGREIVDGWCDSEREAGRLEN